MASLSAASTHDGVMCTQVVGKYVGMGSSNEVGRVRYITQVIDD